MATEFADTQTDGSSLTAEGHVFEISEAAFFEAAHFMAGKPEDHPYRSIHGHSFRIDATVAGRVRPGAQWVEDFGHLKSVLDATAAKLDHRLLNEIEGLEPPTLERLCLWVAADLRPHLPGLVRVSLSRPSLNQRCELVLARP